MELFIYTDGASSGNPGKGGIGVIIKDKEGKKILEVSKHLEKVTNNQAEYLAVIEGLKEAKRIGGRKIHLFVDSKLICQQMKRRYRIKEPELKKLYEKAMVLFYSFPWQEICYIPREKNKEADSLAKKGVKHA